MSNFANPESRVISWFVDVLRMNFPDGFTTRQAIVQYRAWHKCSHRRDQYWCEMNARNSLCCMVQIGILTRVSKGVYIHVFK